MRPQPTEEEIQFILDAIGEYLTVKVRRGDVKSAWSGIRPLAIDPHAKGNDIYFFIVYMYPLIQ